MVADGQEEKRKISSYAWLKRPWHLGIVTCDPGMLVAVGDRVSLVTTKGQQFEADRTEIGVKWRPLSFSTAMNLTVGDDIYRLTLARPNVGAPTFGEGKASLGKKVFDVLTAAEWEDHLRLARDLYRGRASGKAWKAYFGAVMPAPAAAEPRTVPEEFMTAPDEHAIAPDEHGTAAQEQE